MEYDEDREITRLIAEEMLKVGSSFPQIPEHDISLIAAIHLTKGLILERQYQDFFQESCAAVVEQNLLDFDDTEIRDLFNQKLKQLKDLGSRPIDRVVRVKTATYLIDLYIVSTCNILPSHPLAVAALVGSIHSTLRSQIIEMSPTTAELSMGRVGIDDSSFPMALPNSRALRNLISLKLIINHIYPDFIDRSIPSRYSTAEPSYLFDLAPQFNFKTVTGLTNLAEFALEHSQAARFMLVFPATKTKYGGLIAELAPALDAGLRLDAAICFSTTENKSPSSDQVLLIFSQYIHPSRKPRIYIDVSNSNKSLERLDLQE